MSLKEKENNLHVNLTWRCHFIGIQLAYNMQKRQLAQFQKGGNIAEQTFAFFGWRHDYHCNTSAGFLLFNVGAVVHVQRLVAIFTAS